MKRTSLTLTHILLYVVVGLIFCSTCWGPPGPPPSTPVGDLPFTLLAAGALAGYGYWKNRK